MRLLAASQEAKETQLQHVSYIKPQDTWLKFFMYNRGENISKFCCSPNLTIFIVVEVPTYITTIGMFCRLSDDIYN